MQGRYQVQFERSLSAATAMNNYEYLDILDRAWQSSGIARPRGGVVCDVGCASFWYASAMAAFFAPQELIGVDIEGYRLFKDGRARIDYATGYLSDQAGRGRFIVADYADCSLPADVIIAWFPFVTVAALLAWRLPLSLLAPQRLFAQIRHNLRPGAVLWMVNHGVEEAELAHAYCVAAKLHRIFEFAEPGLLSGHRARTAVVSCWARS